MQFGSIGWIAGQHAEAQRHLEAHQEEPSFLLALAFILAQTTQDQARGSICVCM